jgi:hypothetical protein
MFGKRKSKEGERTSLPLQTFPSWRGNLEFCARRAWIERGEIPRPVSEQKVRPRLPAPRVPLSSSAHFARWIFSRRTTESLQTRPPCSPMTKTSHMKTKFNPAQRHHRSLTELVAQKFTYSQNRMSPVAARCECDCVIESTSRRALMRISTSVTFQNTVFVLEETRRGRGRARRR